MLIKIVLVYYLAINIILFLAMAIDKAKAVKGRWRIPESTLFILSVLGGAVGGFAAMYLFHHKNRKWSFKIIFALCLILHLVLVVFIVNTFISKNDSMFLFLPESQNDSFTVINQILNQ